MVYGHPLSSIQHPLENAGTLDDFGDPPRRISELIFLAEVGAFQRDGKMANVRKPNQLNDEGSISPVKVDAATVHAMIFAQP